MYLTTCSTNNPIYRGPMSRPTKLISGYSSWGIITLSLTLVAGGLQERNTRLYEQKYKLSHAIERHYWHQNHYRSILLFITHYLLSPFQLQQQPVPRYFHNEKFKPPLSYCLIFNTLCKPAERNRKWDYFSALWYTRKEIAVGTNCRCNGSVMHDTTSSHHCNFHLLSRTQNSCMNISITFKVTLHSLRLIHIYWKTNK